MVAGIYVFGKKRVACRNAYCSTCEDSRLAEGRRSLVVLHLLFIPLLPVALITRWYCSSCGQKLDARSPSRPWLLKAGMLLSLVFAGAGLAALLEAGKGEDRPMQAAWILLGLAAAFGLWRLLKRQDYAKYQQGRKAVAPLPAHECPICRTPLLQSTKPRCHACEVDILLR